MQYEKGSIFFTLVLGFVIIAVLIGMVFVATNSVKNKNTEIIKKPVMVNTLHEKSAKELAESQNKEPVSTLIKEMSQGNPIEYVIYSLGGSEGEVKDLALKNGEYIVISKISNRFMVTLVSVSLKGYEHYSYYIGEEGAYSAGRYCSVSIIDKEDSGKVRLLVSADTGAMRPTLDTMVLEYSPSQKSISRLRKYENGKTDDMIFTTGWGSNSGGTWEMSLFVNDLDGDKDKELIYVDEFSAIDDSRKSEWSAEKYEYMDGVYRLVESTSSLKGGNLNDWLSFRPKEEPGKYYLHINEVE
jgi:hypothetical protein